MVESDCLIASGSEFQVYTTRWEKKFDRKASLLELFKSPRAEVATLVFSDTKCYNEFLWYLALRYRPTLLRLAAVLMSRFTSSFLGFFAIWCAYPLWQQWCSNLNGLQYGHDVLQQCLFEDKIFFLKPYIKRD